MLCTWSYRVQKTVHRLSVINIEIEITVAKNVGSTYFSHKISIYYVDILEREKKNERTLYS